MAVDAGHVYWTNTQQGAIGRADLDGTNVNNTFITGPSLSGQWPVPCATDSTYIYWTLLGVSQPWIGRARLDGTDIQADFINVHPFSTPFSSPAGCAIAPTTTAPPTTTEAPTTATAAPSPATTLTITGNPALTDQMVVHVIGEGLVPDVTYTASECKVEPPYAVWRGNCFIATSHSVTADATGTVSTDLKVQKVFPGPGGGLGDPPGQVDCGVLPGCMVSLSREEANGVISFVGAFLGHLGGAVGTWDPSTGGGGGQGRVP